MSPYQTASLAIVMLGVTLFLTASPLLRVAWRSCDISPHAQEANLVVWISRILGLLVAVLGYVTYLQS